RLSGVRKETEMKIRSYHLMAIAALMLVTVAFLCTGMAERRSPRDQVLTTTDGRKILATFDSKGYSVRLSDGEYKLTNGGAIRVKSGRIVWDAFGAIERLKHEKGGAVQIGDTIG